MSYNVKNYTEQGGDKTVIGGELLIEDGAKVTGLPSSPAFNLEVANSSELGGIKADPKTENDSVSVVIGDDDKLYVPKYPTVPTQLSSENQAESTAETVEDLVAEFNALLSKLKTSGLMAED